MQSIAAAAATMEAPARPTDQAPSKAPGKPATQKPTVYHFSTFSQGCQIAVTALVSEMVQALRP